MSKEILIADPDKMIQEELEQFLETTDHHLLFTVNEEEALLRARLFKPDLIIGGKSLCQAIRTDQELKDIPFIILLDMFEDVSEPERKFLQADGTLSRPLSEEEVLLLVNRLIGSVPEGTGEKVVSGGDPRLKSFFDLDRAEIETREEFSLNGLGGADEEEIIELIDVIEEPESKMSIDDFALQQKIELTGEIVPLESWEKGVGEAEETITEELSLGMEEEAVEKKVSPEKELFDMIEPEEILRKVEKLAPSIEKEWPAEEQEKVPEVQEKAIPSLAIPERGAMESIELQELPAEEFPEFFLEELEEELEKLKGEALSVTEKAVEVQAEPLVEEEISDLLGEDIPPQEQALEELVRLEALPRTEGERLPSFEGFIPTEPLGETMPSPEQALVEGVAALEELTPARPAGEAVLPPEQAFEEIVRLEAPPAYEEPAPIEALQEGEIPIPKVMETPKIPLPEVSPPVTPLDRKIEEIISKGVQEMMQDFIAKSIPEVASHMITLTMERIETMVKEVIPDLAEKAIREEIERLQKGDKD